jgi:hypothetical protein
MYSAMSGRLDGSSVRLEIVAAGMLLVCISVVVLLFAVVDAPVGGMFSRLHPSQGLYGLGGCLFITGVGLTLEAPWAWLPSLGFSLLVFGVNVWAAAAMGYIPWILLQSETREVFLGAERPPLSIRSRDMCFGLLLTVLMAISVTWTQLTSR